MSKAKRFLSTADLARKWGCSRQSVRRWRQRQVDPLPAQRSPGSGWAVFDEVKAQAWFDKVRPI